MFKITNGLSAWGYFKKGVIYLEDVIDGGVYEKVLRHEIFHKIYDEFLSPEQRGLLTKLAIEEGALDVEEWLADKFMEYKSKKSKFAKALDTILDYISSIFTFIKRDFKTIEDVFEAIERGKFSKPYFSSFEEGKAYLKVKEQFGTSEAFNKSKLFVIANLNNLITNGASTEKGFVPLSFNDAVNYFLKEAAITKYKLESQLRSGNLAADMKSKAEALLNQYNLLLAKEGKGTVAEELVEYLFPSFKFKQNTEILEYFEDDQEGLEEAVREGAGLKKETEESDLVNHEGKLSSEIKLFLSTVINPATKQQVNPRFVYYMILSKITGLNTKDFKTLETQLKSSFGSLDTSSKDAIYVKIKGLLEKANASIFKGRPISKDIVFETRAIKGSSIDTLIYKGVVYSREGNESNLKFFTKLSEQTGLDFETLKFYYNKFEASNTLNTLFTNANSLYKQNLKVGEFTREGGSRVYVYRPLIKETTEQAAKADVKFYVSENYKQALKLKDKFIEYSAARFEDYNKKLDLVKEFYKSIGLSADSLTIDAGQIDGLIDTIKFLLGDIDALPAEGTDISTASKVQLVTIPANDESEAVVRLKNIEDVLQSSNGNLNTISQALSNSSEKARSASYRRGDGKRAWLHTASSQVIDTLLSLTTKFLTKPEFFQSKYFKQNPIVSGDMTIREFVNHDSIKELDNEENAILYSDEKELDWLSRHINYGFFGFIKNNSNKPGFINFFYTISNKPRIVGAAFDFMKDDIIRNNIRKAVVQASTRDASYEFNSDNVPKNYDKNKSNTGLFDLKTLSEEDLKDPAKIEEAVEYVMNKMNNRAKELAQHLVDNKFLFDGDIRSIYASLKGFANLPEKGLNDFLPSHNNYKVTVDEILPLIELYYKNYYTTSYFMNQVGIGDTAFFKNEYDVIKRMSIAFATGYKGFVNNITGLKETYKVAVLQDTYGQITEQLYNEFPKLFGKNFNKTDAQGFMTSRRAQNIRKGFGRALGLGIIMKAVYYGIDSNGVPRAVKYSTIEITDQLAKQFPLLKKLRFDMEFRGLEERDLNRAIELSEKRINGTTLSSSEFNELEALYNKADAVDEAVFESAVKVGSPIESNMSKFNTRTGIHDITDSSIITLSNDYFRIQLDPQHDTDSLTAQPTQLMYYLGLEGENIEQAVKAYRYTADIINEGLAKIRYELKLKGRITDDTITTIRTAIARTMGTPGTEAQQELLLAKKNGKYVASLNTPSLTKKVLTQFSSMISKATVQVKFPGTKLVLQSEYGSEIVSTILNEQELSPLKWRNDEGYCEVYLPDMYKGKVQVGDRILFDTMLGFRIPSTGLHSAIPIVVKGFYNDKYNSNIIIAPGEITFFHGSDYDIDALYIIRRELATKELIDETGKLIIPIGVVINYGEQGTEPVKINDQELPEFLKSEIERVKGLLRQEAIENKPELVRYLKDLRGTVSNEGFAGKSTKNALTDVVLEVITASRNKAIMMSPISTARVKDFTGGKWDETIFDMIARLKQAAKGITEPINSEKEREAVLFSSRDLNDPLDQMAMHQDNFSGNLLTGLFANNAKAVAYAHAAIARNAPMDLKKEAYLEATSEEYNKAVEALSKVTKEASKIKYNTIIENLKAGLNDKVVSDFFDNNVIIKSKYHVTLNGKVYNSLYKKERDSNGDLSITIGLDKDGNQIAHITYGTETIDLLINAAIDNVKEQILAIINATNLTGNAYIAAVAMGIPFNTVVRLMIQPSIRYANQFKNVTGVSSYINNLLKEKGYTEEQMAKIDDVVESIELTDEVLEKDAFKELTDMSIEELLIQKAVIKAFSKIDATGTSLSNFSRYLGPLRILPVFYNKLQDVFDIRDEMFSHTETNEGAILYKDSDTKTIPVTSSKFAFSNINPFSRETTPHIGAMDTALKSLKYYINKIILRHNKTLIKFSEDIGKSFKLDKKSKNNNAELIRNEFIKYMIAGIEYKAEDKTYKFDTTEEPSIEVKVGDYTKFFNGVQAWNERFIQRLNQEKRKNPTNMFLSSFTVDKDNRTYGSKLVFRFDSNLDPVDIDNLRTAFEELNDSTQEYSDFQHDFVKYAALNQGLNFGVASYSLILPTSIMAEPLNAIDVILENVFSDNITDNKTSSLLEHIKEHFRISLGVAYPDSLPFIPKSTAERSFYNAATDDGSLVYEIKFKKIAEDDGTKFASEYPLISQSIQGDKIVFKLVKETETEAYYQRVGKQMPTVTYQFNVDMLYKPYDVASKFDPTLIVQAISNPYPNEEGKFTLIKTDKGWSYGAGRAIALHNYSDYTRINMQYYTIESVEKFVETASDGGTQNKIRYNLTLNNELKNVNSQIDPSFIRKVFENVSNFDPTMTDEQVMLYYEANKTNKIICNA